MPVAAPRESPAYTCAYLRYLAGERTTLPDGDYRYKPIPAAERAAVRARVDDLLARAARR